MKTKYKYIHFTKMAEKPKTVVYGCYNNKSGDDLGYVEWYGPWRQYCFMPVEMRVFNIACLEDIQNFIKQLPRPTRRLKPKGTEEG